MRARLLKPGFFKNEELAKLPPLARLCFQGLWLLADREGRLEDRPERIKIEVFPYENLSLDQVESILCSLHQAGFSRRYLDQRGHRYIAIPHFLDHQTPHHREAPSRIPPPSSKVLHGRGDGLGRTRGKPRAQPGSSRAVPVPVPVPVPVGPANAGPAVPVTREARKSGAAGAARSTPDENITVITKLAHEAINEGLADDGELVERIKVLSAQHGISYSSAVVKRALDSARVQRRMA